MAFVVSRLDYQNYCILNLLKIIYYGYSFKTLKALVLWKLSIQSLYKINTVKIMVDKEITKEKWNRSKVHNIITKRP